VKAQDNFAFTLMIALTACGGSNGLSHFTPTATAPLFAAPQSVALGSASPPATAGANLYVANIYAGTVTVYAPGSNKVLQTISQGLNGPWRLAFGRFGSLFVANLGHDTRTESVAVYARGSNKLLRKITQGVLLPNALAVNGSGDLFVSNCAGRNLST
jgi:YVTN family beta-propeller protein